MTNIRLTVTRLIGKYLRCLQYCLIQVWGSLDVPAGSLKLSGYGVSLTKALSPIYLGSSKSLCTYKKGAHLCERCGMYNH